MDKESTPSVLLRKKRVLLPNLHLIKFFFPVGFTGKLSLPDIYFFQGTSQQTEVEKAACWTAPESANGAIDNTARVQLIWGTRACPI